MGSVGMGFSMSLDGFIAGENDDITHVFAWMFAGNSELNLKSGDENLDLKVTEEGAEVFESAQNETGALLCGRRLFDVAHAWGGKHPLNVPIVVLTHNTPAEWAGKEPFTFVNEGIENAVATAQKIAGNKRVAIASGDVARQAIKAGLVDDIHLDLVPVLLGSGIRLFEYLGIEPVHLEITNVQPDKGVTHLDYRVKK
jgi:dihydrofolate reductase